MSTLTVVLVVLLGLVIVLAIGGAIANARRRRATVGAFEDSLEEVNRALAAAHAEDKGWEPSALDAAAVRAFEQARPGAEVRRHVLVQVDDRPGTEHDKAVFRFDTEAGEAHVTLGRVDGEWVTDTVTGA